MPVKDPATMTPEEFMTMYGKRLRSKALSEWLAQLDVNKPTKFPADLSGARTATNRAVVVRGRAKRDGILVAVRTIVSDVWVMRLPSPNGELEKPCP